MPGAVFIGGGTGGGKTTVARALAARHGLRQLRIDDFWYEHAARSGERPPPPDVQWLEWTPQTQAADFERISRLMFGHVLSDLSDLPEQPSVVVEGPQILPDMLPVDAPAVFLVPTPAFQRRVLTARPMPSRNPDRALAARLVKDRLYADRIASLARERGFRVLEIDGGQPLRDVVAEVEAQLVRGLAGTEPRDLEAVRRWENENKARNVSAWIASGDLRGAEALPVPFACECGALGCDRDVELTLAEFESERDRPVVADRHRA